MFLDIGAGILISIFVSRLFDVPLSVTFIIGGIFFALLVDIDYIFYFFSNKSLKNVHRHRDLLHYPLLYIPLGILFASFINVSWAVLFGLCSLAHFIHDSIGIGWGVQWFYPFTKDHYAFFYLYQPPNKEKLPKKFIYIWKHENISVLDFKYGDDNWIRDIYLKFHPYAVFEFLVFLISLIILYFLY